MRCSERKSIGNLIKQKTLQIETQAFGSKISKLLRFLIIILYVLFLWAFKIHSKSMTSFYFSHFCFPLQGFIG